MKTEKDDPAYRLLLPTPEMAAAVGAGVAGGASAEVGRALAELEKAGGAVPPEQVAIICDRVITEFALVDDAGIESPHSIAEEDGAIYDEFFAVRRLPASADEDAVLSALAVAIAVVMKNTVAHEAESPGVTAVEFGLLRHALAVIVESLHELSGESHPKATP